MATMPCRLALVGGALAAIVAASAAAQTTPPIYRYVDPSGRVIYSDHVPPPNAKNVEAKRLTQNYIETDKMSLEAKQARDRFPVTLYTFNCGDVCDKAEALLNRRGVPFSRRRREGSERRGPVEESERRRPGAGAAGRRQADRQGLQRNALAGVARRRRLSEGADATSPAAIAGGRQGCRHYHRPHACHAGACRARSAGGRRISEALGACRIEGRELERQLAQRSLAAAARMAGVGRA
jgi:hypothetical protein